MLVLTPTGCVIFSLLFSFSEGLSGGPYPLIDSSSELVGVYRTFKVIPDAMNAMVALVDVAGDDDGTL